KSSQEEGRKFRIVGGILLLPTWGLSKILMNHGDNISKSGINEVQHAQTVKFEATDAFARYATMVETGIQVVEHLSTELASFCADLRGLSQYRDASAWVIARAKGIELAYQLAKYVTLSESIFGEPNFYPYEIRSTVTCQGDGCHKV